MKKFLYLLSYFFLVTLVLPAGGQEFIRNSKVTGICYAGNKVNKIYIPPPNSFLTKSGNKGGGSITVYYTGFTNQARNAVEYAKSILESMLPADTKLTILAFWEKIATQGVLGNTVVTGFAGGWGIDALYPKAYYPVALAEKIAGRSLNPDLEGDLELRINSTANWYLATDGLPTSGKYDLVTVVLHEICHGLGFYDSMNTDAGTGYYSSIPLIYDTFIENESGKKLIDTLQFTNPSSALKSLLIGGPLWFNGPLMRRLPSGLRARLYTPDTWDNGSSVSHLDELTYDRQDGQLMTPFIDRQEAIHNPGKLILSMLQDLGWLNTRIIHNPPGDTEKNISQVLLPVQIRSDTSYNRDKVGVVFSFDDFKSSDTLFLTSQTKLNNFSTNINIPYYNSELQYYFYVEDYFKRIYRSPSLIERFKYTMYIGIDTIKPEIIHTPENYFLETVDTINFKALARDNLGIDTVYVEYKVSNGAPKFIGMNPGKSESYSAFINGRQLNLNGGDSIKYRIFAIDSALKGNIAVLPKTGYFVVGIEDIGTVVESYKTDFANASSDFFTSGFSITKPSGFSKSGLHTKHPYESPEDNDKSFDFIALLRHPLKFKESGLLINYSEIVLVEPGETGSVYGSSEFYDYVILEGSKNFGKTWFPLIDGYDSRYNSTWEEAYNSSVVDQNSTYVGTESMLKKHTVFYAPSDKFAAEDTLLLRFRLFSDPFANGWGWVIEDLKINPLIDAVETISSEPYRIYPNPGDGLIKIKNSNPGNVSGRPSKYKVFNSSGIPVDSGIISGDSEALIDISGFPSGIYIIVIYENGGIKTFKYGLIK